MDKDKIAAILDSVAHPEKGVGIVAAQMVKDIAIDNRADGRAAIAVELQFGRRRDPFAASLRRQAEAALAEAFPNAEVTVSVFEPEKETAAEPSRKLPGVKHIVAIASGKGGVGKSTVAANLALAFTAEGYKTGILDADIYGPSQPALFGVEDYVPMADGDSPQAAITPAESGGVKIMSIGFFISPSNALVWRGPMASKALSQLIRQTSWGELDYLLIDLPPGTGDLHLSIVQELELDGAVIVSTPQSLALADVRRGAEMFRAEGVGVPLLGVVENMAWFTPAELPDNRYYIFGHGETERFARQMGIDFLGHIPLFASAEGESDASISENRKNDEKRVYTELAKKIVGNLPNICR